MSKKIPTPVKDAVQHFAVILPNLVPSNHELFMQENSFEENGMSVILTSDVKKYLDAISDFKLHT